MKITKNFKEKPHPIFKDIPVGAWFIDRDGDIAVKLNSRIDGEENCIYFKENGGHPYEVDAEEYAYPVEVELVVTDKR